MSQLRDDLVAAKALITDPAKWAKDAPEDEEGRRCALAACWHVDMGDDSLGPLGHALTAAVPVSFVPDRSTKLVVAQFNDDPTTTHADIMALFDRAIGAAS